MEARRDVPSYRSWVFPLQTAVRMMEAESAPATFSSPSPLSFLPSLERSLLCFPPGCGGDDRRRARLLSHTLHIPTFPIFVLENEVTPSLVRLLFFFQLHVRAAAI